MAGRRWSYSDGLPTAELPKHLTANKWARCAAIKGDSRVPVPTASWSWNPSEQYATPNGAASFNTSGSTSFAHGGISLQRPSPRSAGRVCAATGKSTADRGGRRLNGSGMSEVVASQVSVRNLKTHLSEWLGRVKAGEVVEVTSHRKPIARITAVNPAESTIERFADVFALRGYDSVQLAAAQELQLKAEQPVIFASYDRRLNQAAQLLQLGVLQ